MSTNDLIKNFVISVHMSITCHTILHYILFFRVKYVFGPSSFSEFWN